MMYDNVDVVMLMSTAAQIRASAKYNKKAYDRLLVTVRKEIGGEIRDHTKHRDESVSGFFNRAAALQVAVDVGAVSVVGEVPPLVVDCEGEGDDG